MTGNTARSKGGQKKSKTEGAMILPPGKDGKRGDEFKKTNLRRGQNIHRRPMEKPVCSGHKHFVVWGSMGQPEGQAAV